MNLPLLMLSHIEDTHPKLQYDEMASAGSPANKQ